MKKARVTSHRIRRSPSGWAPVFLALLTAVGSMAPAAAQVDPSNVGALRWRLLGPFRAGRVSAGAIDPSDANTYYFGTPGGGVWKSTNGGQTWAPIFDQTGMASIGALAIAPSNPQIIYAGTGEETRGDGVYKSTDGGRSWTNVGLRDTHYIGSIVISATNPDELVVGAIGDRTPSRERGVFHTTDGGKTWTQVLFVDDTAGCPSVVAAPDAPRILFATLYPSAGLRGASLAQPIIPGQPPAPGGPPYKRDPAVFRSTDGGATWTKLAATGLPSPPLGRQAFGVVAKSGGRIVLAGLNDGLYRSEDGGETWTRANHDPRIRPVGVITDPSNPDLVYVTQTALYRSKDGGRTFAAFAGAPSGDDFQFLWIDPHNSGRLFAGVDQGAIVSVDAGVSWSSWYNQPTGQFYHVVTDDRFPYHVYAAQQDSGSVAVPNRSDFGEISYRDWFSPGGFEFGYLAPDPLDPDIVFAGGWYRTVVRFDRRTGQIVHVFVPGTKYRSVNNAPMFFSPQDPHTLYYGTQFLMKTTDAGMTWTEASPDLTNVPARTQTPPTPPTASVPTITTFSLSTVKAGVIWAATNNGVIQVTADGGATWTNVSPPDVPVNGAFEIVEAGRHDAATAYATLIVPQDVRPYIYRTQDGGATWQRITAGLPDTAFARVVREDPVRKGLLFCGTESAMHVSFDAGDHWQSLQLDLPASSMRDLWVHGEDLVLGTYGRALWILDDITPLRQLGTGAQTAGVRLYEPAPAIRARWDVNGDTPLPVEAPTAPNPPEGAIIDYSLPAIPDGEVTLTITDARGKVVRTFTSTASTTPTLLPNVPDYWFAQPSVLTKNRGLNRFGWNLRYPNPRILPFGYSGGLLDFVEYTLADHAIPGRTPRDQPEGPLAVPGTYTVELSAGGTRDRQTLVVKPDPRTHASAADLDAQLEFATRLTDALAVTYDSYSSLKVLRASVTARLTALADARASRDVIDAVQAFDKKLDAVQNGTNAAPGVGVVNRDLARYYMMLTSGDARPAERLRAAVAESCQGLIRSLELWRTLNAADLPAVNKVLAKATQAPFAPVAVPATPACLP